MSLGLWPEAVPFDPNSGTASHDLRKHFDPARMPAASMLVCARDLRGAEWPARAAIGLARAVATGDRPVLLLDLDFEKPTLHEMLGAANTEGVADAILFGASLERVTVEPAGEMFGFVPPGAVAPDPAELMADSSWARLLAELAVSDGLLLAYAPLGAPGIDALAERISSVVVLAEEIEVAGTAAMLPESIRVDGVIRPAEAVEPAEAAAPPIAEAPPAESPPTEVPGEPEADEASPAEAQPVTPPSTKEAARQALKADIEARLRAAAEAQAQPPAPAPNVASRPEPARARPVRPVERVERVAIDWRRVLTWAAVIAVIAAVAVLIGKQLARPAGETAARGPDGASVAEPAGSLLAYSVAVESYDDYDAAVVRADSLALAAPDLSFYVAPVRAADDAIIYRVLAGTMTDSATASATMRRLVQQGLKIAESPFDVRSTPLAFLVGEYEFRGDAEARMTELKAQAVPGYVIEVPYTRGSARYHVYAGAYSGPTEALVMRERLRGAGVEDTLVLRVGRSLP